MDVMKKLIKQYKYRSFYIVPIILFFLSISLLGLLMENLGYKLQDINERLFEKLNL